VAFVLGNPALVHLVQRHRIQEMQLLSPTPDHRHEVGSFQQSQVLSNSLPGHFEPFTQLGQSLAVAAVQLVEQLSAAVIGQGFENRIYVVNMQLFGCIFKQTLSFEAR